MKNRIYQTNLYHQRELGRREDNGNVINIYTHMYACIYISHTHIHAHIHMFLHKNPIFGGWAKFICQQDQSSFK